MEICKGETKKEKVQDREEADEAEDVLASFLWHFLSNEAVNQQRHAWFIKSKCLQLSLSPKFLMVFTDVAMVIMLSLTRLMSKSVIILKVTLLLAELLVKLFFVMPFSSWLKRKKLHHVNVFLFTICETHLRCV